MFFHQKYLYEMTNGRVGIGTFVIEIADPDQAAAIGKAVDALFENSDAQTKTETEAAFRAGFVSMAGNLALLLNGIALAVMFTILLVTANTMSMAVRERRTEIAVLKTLGFTSSLVMILILVESALLGALGGSVGIVLGREMIQALPYLPMIGDAVRGFPELGLSPLVAAMAFALAVGIGLAAGFIPAILAYRARIADMLRQV
jgi:putative ABC transport system permease protein